jgi:hypothetical protein
LESSDVLATSSEALNLPTLRVSVDSATTRLEGNDAPATSSEKLPTVQVSEDSATTSLGSSDASATNRGQHSPPPSNDPSADDPVAKKNQDMALFVRNQRRRRRMRIGY